MRDLFRAQEALEEVVESKEKMGELDRNSEELARQNNGCDPLSDKPQLMQMITSAKSPAESV